MSHVFISYVRQDADLVDKLASELRSGGAEVWLDRGNIMPGVRWRDAIAKAIKGGAFFIACFSEEYSARDTTYADEELTIAIDQLRKQHTDRTWFIPVLLNNARIPNRRISDVEELSDIQAVRLCADNWHDGIQRILGVLGILSVLDDEVLHRMTLPSVVDFVGRARELNKLNEYFSDDSVAICDVIAGPGTGKTALVSRWLDQIERHGPNHLRKFIWSFSEPEGSPTPIGNLFLARARFGFGSSDSPDHAQTAKQLTDVFYAQPVVMVLDGLAPFSERRGGNQNARNAEFVPDSGWRASMTKLDDAVKIFLHNIQNSNGARLKDRLVVITSREPLRRYFRADSYQSIQLHGLSDEEGAALLRKRGLRGRKGHLENASHQLCGHPLALRLFPQYAKSRYDGNVQRTLNFDSFFSDILSERVQFVEKWAGTVISYYSEKWKDDHPQKILLEMISLVHREMKTPELDALISQAELARTVRTIPESDWQRHYEELEESGLIVRQESGLKGWNCHPVIRSYMRESLRCKKPHLWTDAHNVLFEHFRRIVRPEPSTSTELLNVYRAITHGCHAGRYDDAYKIYEEKCLHGISRAFSTNSIGSFADDVVVLRLLSGAGPKLLLASKDLAIVYGRLAFCYTCLGWLGDAIGARHQELEIWKSNPIQDSIENIKQYAASLAELSSVYLYRGSLPAAERYADDAIAKADECGDWWTRMRSRVRKALVEYIKNNVGAACRLFHEAEEIQINGDDKKRRVLYGEEGWFYNMVLLDTGHKSPSAVEGRCRRIQSSMPSHDDAWVIMDGLNHVQLGEALLMQQKKEEGWAKLHKGVNILYKVNSQVHLLFALLRQARAEIEYGDVEKATKIINEAVKITEDHELPYLRANAYIYDIRNAIKAVAGQAGHGEQAKEYLQRAASCLGQLKWIVRDHFYLLREAEVDKLEQEIGQFMNKGSVTRGTRHLLSRTILATQQPTVVRRVASNEPNIGDTSPGIRWGDSPDCVNDITNA